MTNISEHKTRVTDDVMSSGGGYGLIKYKMGAVDKDKEMETVMTEETEVISIDCDEILDFLQYVLVKASRVSYVPFPLCSNRHAREWFCGWSAWNLVPISSTHPHHSTGSLRNHRCPECCLNTPTECRGPLPSYFSAEKIRLI